MLFDDQLGVERELLTIIRTAEWLAHSTNWRVANRRQDELLEKWKPASRRLRAASSLSWSSRRERQGDAGSDQYVLGSRGRVSVRRRSLRVRGTQRGSLAALAGCGSRRLGGVSQRDEAQSMDAQEASGGGCAWTAVC